MARSADQYQSHRSNVTVALARGATRGGPGGRARIAVVVHSFPSRSETFILNLVAGQIERGSDVTILSAAGAAEISEHALIEQHGILERTALLPQIPPRQIDRIRGLIGLARASGAKGARTLMRAVASPHYGRRALSLALAYETAGVQRHGPFDVLHCQYGPVGAWALPLRQIGATDGALITSFRGYDLGANYSQEYYRNLFSEGELFLPVCNAFSLRLQEMGCAPDRIRTHYSGIDCAAFPYRSRKLLPGETPRVASVARLVEKKGLEYGVGAVAKLIAAGKQLTYRIYGEGPLRDRLHETIKLLGVEQFVTLAGAIAHETVSSVLDQAHIFVAPSVTTNEGDQEGIPNSLKEAMACGLPVVATRHSGIPELVDDGVSGLLVRERDVRGLADALSRLLEADQRWPAMGAAGRRRVEMGFDNSRLSGDLAKIYAEAVGRRKAYGRLLP